MKVGFILDNFPTLSQTFVVNQIASLLRVGIDVQIFAEAEGKDAVVGELVTRFKLLDRTHYYGAGLPGKSRTARMRALLQSIGTADLGVLRAINPLRMGRRAFNLKAVRLYRAFRHSKLADCDVVICHFGPNGLVATDLKLMDLCSAPVAVVFHGYDITRLVARKGEGLYRDLFRVCDLMLPISTRWQKRLLELGCPPEKTRVHRMGVDVAQLEFKTQPVTRVRELLSAARLMPKKGIEYAIRAVGLLRDRGVDVRYRVIGDGPLEPELTELVHSLRLEDRVTLLGARKPEEVLCQMRRADLVLVPSVTAPDGDQEGIPVALMEAMSLGVPVLTTRHSGIPELVQHEETGTLVDEGSAEQLASAIEAMVSEPARLEPMRVAGRAAVEAHFNEADLQADLAQMLRNLRSASLSGCSNL